MELSTMAPHPPGPVARRARTQTRVAELVVHSRRTVGTFLQIEPWFKPFSGVEMRKQTGVGPATVVGHVACIIVCSTSKLTCD